MRDGTLQLPRLVGDIGGTNTRLGLYNPADKTLDHVRSFENRDYAQLSDIIAQWLEMLGASPPSHCCLAVAAPPFKESVQMLNIDWAFSISELRSQFGFDQLRCINDFEANALAIPHLRPDDLYALQMGAEIEDESPICRKIAVVGPGTGLGGASLEYCLDTPVASASEPGHMGLSPGTPLEIEIFKVLGEDHAEVYAELLLSGPGLLRLYQTLGKVRDEAAPLATPAAVSESAIQGECSLCVESLGIFCALLGSLCGDYVLATGSYGGLYLAGGIIPRMTQFLQHSDMQSRFAHKGEMVSHLSRVPVHAITLSTAGLLGAAHAELQTRP